MATDQKIVLPLCHILKSNHVHFCVPISSFTIIVISNDGCVYRILLCTAVILVLLNPVCLSTSSLMSPHGVQLLIVVMIPTQFGTLIQRRVIIIKSRQNFFGYDDFGLYPIRTGSPSAASVVGKEAPLFDSAPSTPLFSSSFSPRFNEGPDDNSFDSFARFDSFRVQESGVTQNQTFARFDSFRSTTDYHDSGVPQNQTLPRFDFIGGSMADYPQHKTYSTFDSIRSTTDYSRGFSFNDADPFGSGPFKSKESHSPRTGTDNWKAF